MSEALEKQRPPEWSHTPITDAAVVRFVVAPELDRFPAGEWVAAGVARGLEQERNALHSDIRKCEQQLIAATKVEADYVLAVKALRDEIKRLDYPRSMFPQQAQNIARRQEAFEVAARYLEGS